MVVSVHRTFTKMQHLNVFPINLRIGKQRTKLMLLAAYWVHKLKQVDISLLKHIKPGFFFLLNATI